MHAFWVMNDKMFLKKLLAVHPKSLMRKRKRRREKEKKGNGKVSSVRRKSKKRKAVANRFELHANAINPNFEEYEGIDVFLFTVFNFE